MAARGPQWSCATTLSVSSSPLIDDYRVQIEAALVYAGNEYTFEDVKREVAENKLQFWPGTTSVIITTIVNNPQEKLLHFFLAGGNMAELEAMTPLVLEWGKQQGCTRASLVGRRGWLKSFLVDTGWKDTKLVLMEKDLHG